MDFRADLRKIRVHNPDAAKIAKLSGRDAERLADLAIHRADLNFAKRCTHELAALPQSESESVVEHALFRSAIVTWAKCFSSSRAGRFTLDLDEIYPGEELRDNAKNAKALRNKHIAHDDNPFSQSVPIAVVAAADAERKVMQILTLAVSVNVDPRGPNLENLNLLLDEALRWVDAETVRVIMAIRDDLESRDYAELISLPEPSVTPPDADDVAKTRKRDK